MRQQSVLPTEILNKILLEHLGHVIYVDAHLSDIRPANDTTPDKPRNEAYITLTVATHQIANMRNIRDVFFPAMSMLKMVETLITKQRRTHLP